jgi:hypothetical protein
MEARLVLTWYSEQVADHRYRQRVGQVVNDVKLATVTLRVEQAIHELDDLVAHLLDPLWRELMHHQATQAIVIGWVEKNEGRATLATLWRELA